MKFRSTLILFLILVNCSAQQLLVLPENDPNAMHWNPTFMARNSIATIRGSNSAKREGQRIIKKSEVYLYKFDDTGRTIYRNTSYGKPGSGRDTACVQFEYDSKGRLLRELRTDLGGHFEQINTYDSLGQLVTQTYSRVANLNSNRYDLKPGERTEISDERYTYEVAKKLHKKIYFNDRGLPFREELFHYNEKGYLIQIEDVYLMTRRRRIEQFTYDDKGRLAQRLKHGVKGAAPNRTEYHYDLMNNLSKREVFVGQQQIITEEYLYKEDSGLLRARLTKDMQTGIIKIVQYEHSYR